MSWRRVGAVAVLGGMLGACHATDRPAFIAQVEKGMEDNRRQMNRDVAARKASLGTLTASLTGCPMERRQAYEMDAEQEYALGRAVAARQLATLGVEPLPATDPLARYVDQVGQYLTLVAEAVGNSSAPDRAHRPERILENRPWPLAGYRFLVLPMDEARATGSPSGTVMISTGFLRKLQSEEELAAVLAHEVAHVQRGHGVEVLKAFMCHQTARQESSAALRAFGQRIESNARASTGGSALRSSKDSTVLGELLGGAAEGAASLYREGFPKDFELEADRISVRLLAAAGYDPRAVTWLLQRMSTEAPAKHAWVRTHPKFEERMETVGERLKTMGAEQPHPPQEAVAQRTKRFQAAMEPLKAPPAGQQASR
ncbi:M48 family metalloprotease [Hyalangium rubrum]|uniref:M48 family metalloprotease n=1 Tax=Hyalangium rubrum TaxID=3103134 RepID=A0ABU5GXC2_9BACT|nr:M48 family metalloprotease [Hyalangium sp. s54d21]MDY7225133.1 M48 family metalloprotease [Hyalangium sp. s54d21]